MRWLTRRKDKQHVYLVENVGIGLSRPRALGFEEGPGHDRVRDLGRRAGGDRHHCHSRVQTPPAGALDSDCRRNQRSVRGQSTVEFAVVTAGFLAVAVALGALWRALADGLIVEHALTVTPVILADLFLF